MAGDVKVGEMFFELVGRDKAFHRMLDKAESGAKRLGQSLTSIGTRMTAAVTVPLVGIGTAAVNASLKFNEGMANVATLIPGNSARIEQLKADVQSLGIETGTATDIMADGLYQVISAFGDSAESASLLDTNTRAAKAGVATVTDAVNLTSAVTKAYGDTSAEAVEKVADLGLLAVRLGQTTFPELAASIGRVTPLTNELGVAQEELFAVLATATGVTGGAAEVSTQLRGVLQSLLAPTDSMRGLFASLGVESGEAMIAQFGLGGAMEKIVGAAEASGKPLQDFMGSIQGQVLALALAGPQADTYRAKLEEMAHSSGTLSSAFAEQTEGVNAAGHAWEQLKVTGTVALQKIGDAIVTAVDPSSLEAVADAVVALIEGFDELSPGAKKVVVGLGGVAAAAGPVAMVVGQIITAWPALVAAFGALTGPVGLAVAAIGGLTAAFVHMYRENETARQIMQDVWGFIAPFIERAMSQIEAAVQIGLAVLRGDWSAAWEGIKSLASATWGQIVGMARGYGQIMTGIWRNLTSSAVGAASALYSGVKSWLVDKFASIVSGVQRQIDRVKDAFRSLYQAVVGGSYVPDMVTEVKAWMQRLGSDALVDPATAATKEAAEAFSRMNESVVSTVANLGKSLKSVRFWARETGDEWGAMAQEANLLEGTITSLIQNGMDPQDAVIQELTAQWRMLTASVEGHAAALEYAEQQTREMTDAQREQARLLEDFSSEEGLSVIGELLAARGETLQQAADSFRQGLEGQPDLVAEILASARAAQQQLEASRANVLRWAGEAWQAAHEEMQSIFVETGVHARGRDEWNAALMQASENADIHGDILSDIETTTDDTTSHLDEWADKLSEARRWMFSLGIETDSWLGSLINGMQVFLDFGGGIGGIAAGLMSVFGVDVGDLVKNIGRGIGNVAEGIWDVVTSPFKLIGGLADGGTIRTPGMALVGEKGPEIVHLPRAATVEPNGGFRTAAMGPLNLTIELDGRQIAKGTLPHMSREMRLRGVTG